MIRATQSIRSPMQSVNVIGELQTIQKLRLDLQNLFNTYSLKLKNLSEISKGSEGPRGLSIQGPQGMQGPPGEIPTIDLNKLAKLVLKQIKLPKDGRDARQISIEDMIGEIKKKVKFVDHVGLEQTIAPIRSLAAGFRGGGDTVAAGSGISITNSGGVKTIAVGASATSVYGEVVSGSATTFTLAHTPTSGTLRVYANGQRLTLTVDYTLSGAIITTISSWVAGTILADYTY